MRRSFSLILIALASVLLLAPAVSAQTIVSRTRIGGYTEATTFITNGTNSNRIALMDGYDVLTMPIKLGARATKLFSVIGLPIDAAPRGIAWVASEKLFAFADNSHPDMLIFSDQKGRPAGTRTLVYPAGDPYRANRFEGLVYIPTTSTVFPDHIAAVTFCQPNFGTSSCTPYQMRVLVIRRDGLVVKEIIPILPQQVLDDVGEFWGIGFQTPDILLCGGGPYLWKMDFNGNPLTAPVYFPDDRMTAEGVTQLPNGYIAATASAAGKLLFFDSNLNRVAQFDQTYTIGLGISAPSGLAWNNNAKNFLIAETNNEPAVWSVPRSLKTKVRVVNLANVNLPDPQGENPLLDAFRFHQMIYLSGEIVMNYVNAGKPGIPGRVRTVSFDMAGNLVSYQKLFDWNLTPQQVSANTLTYIPPPGSGLGQYVLRNITVSPSVVLQLVWPTDGTSAGTIDLAPTGLTAFGAAEFFNPAHPTGGEFLVFGNGYRAVVADFNGHQISEFNFRDKLGTLGVGDLAYITNGPNAGAFAALDGANSELIIFTLP